MNTGGEAAEQIVRMSLEGFEVAAKITGAGANRKDDAYVKQWMGTGNNRS